MSFNVFCHLSLFYPFIIFTFMAEATINVKIINGYFLIIYLFIFFTFMAEAANVKIINRYNNN